MLSTATINPQPYDVAVIGGGPAGATVATLLVKGGLRVIVFEREHFPRFHVGESLLPANLPIFDRLGCHDTLREAGFLIKPGASFFDEHEGRGQNTFLFQPAVGQPTFSYNVVRATFDDLLLQHAAHSGALVYRQHVVQQLQVQADGVILQVRQPDQQVGTVRARFLVDASGRTALLGGALGQRQPLPDLGKVALFAHYQGAQRDPDVPAGNIQIHLLRHGWAWWIPLAHGMDSIGFVVHAKVAKERRASIEDLFEETLASSPRLRHGLAMAQRLTPVHTAANFSYRVTLPVGERYVSVGDAVGFVDPIFSSGVFIAMRSAELAAGAILRAFHAQDFRAQRFTPYAALWQQGVTPFLQLIQRFYDPAFLDLFFAPNPPLRLYRSVLWVLSGAAFDHRPLWLRGALGAFFASVTIRKALRWARGLPVESRWHW